MQVYDRCSSKTQTQTAKHVSKRLITLPRLTCYLVIKVHYDVPTIERHRDYMHYTRVYLCMYVKLGYIYTT